jgi:hypothetical protein
MFRHWRMILAALAIAFYTFVIMVVASAQSSEPSTAAQSEKSTGAQSSTNKTDREKRLAEATRAAKELLLLMDTDKNGKVSRQEWTKFMNEEFDRLDTDHNGELDVKELTKSRVRARAPVGK